SPSSTPPASAVTNDLRHLSNKSCQGGRHAPARLTPHLYSTLKITLMWKTKGAREDGAVPRVKTAPPVARRALPEAVHATASTSCPFTPNFSRRLSSLCLSRSLSPRRSGVA